MLLLEYIADTRLFERARFKIVNGTAAQEMVPACDNKRASTFRMHLALNQACRAGIPVFILAQKVISGLHLGLVDG